MPQLEAGLMEEHGGDRAKRILAIVDHLANAGVLVREVAGVHLEIRGFSVQALQPRHPAVRRREHAARWRKREGDRVTIGASTVEFDLGPAAPPDQALGYDEDPLGHTQLLVSAKEVLRSAVEAAPPALPYVAEARLPSIRSAGGS